MGESKRRKILDPNYGKSYLSNKSIDLDKIDTSDKLLPDFGEYLTKFGNTPIYLSCNESHIVMVQGKIGSINFSTGTHAATIETTPEIALKYRGKGFTFKVRACPENKYFTKATKEWVTPLEILEEIN